MDRPALANMLRDGPLLSDGGMGTSLVARGVPVGACFEALNDERPDLVDTVHRTFAEAGARMVLTNTFGGNRFALGRRGLADRVVELNAKAVDIARRTGVVVAGSVGPLRVRLAPYGRVRPEEAFEAFAEQISALAAAGADLLLIETQSDLAEMEQAVAAAREASHLAVMVTATFTSDDRTLLGGTPEHVAERLAGLRVDALGVNCGQGPAQALRIIRAMRPMAGDLPLVARPNAGGPLQVGGRFLYPATPEYFAEHAEGLVQEGVAMIGGCCGSGPAHTRAMAVVLERPGGTAIEVVPAADVEPVPGGAAVGTELSSKLVA